MFVLKSTLEKQEKLFEEKLEEKDLEYRQYINTLQSDLQELQSRHKKVLQAYEDNLAQLEISVKHEEFLNNQNHKLHKDLLDATSLSFPEKRFNVQKSVELLTKKLSAKTLATFLHHLVEALGESHLQTLNRYLLQRLSKDNN